MGLIKFSRIKDYWKQDKKGLFNFKCFSKLLSSKKYQLYRKILAFNYDYVEQYTNFVFQKNWICHPVIIVDECLVLFKGRYKGRQHIRGKPHATGFRGNFMY